MDNFSFVIDASIYSNKNYIEIVSHSLESILPIYINSFNINIYILGNITKTYEIRKISDLDCLNNIAISPSIIDKFPTNKEKTIIFTNYFEDYYFNTNYNYTIILKDDYDIYNSFTNLDNINLFKYKSQEQLINFIEQELSISNTLKNEEQLNSRFIINFINNYYTKKEDIIKFKKIIKKFNKDIKNCNMFELLIYVLKNKQENYDNSFFLNLLENKLITELEINSKKKIKKNIYKHNSFFFTISNYKELISGMHKKKEYFNSFSTIRKVISQFINFNCIEEITAQLNKEYNIIWDTLKTICSIINISVNDFISRTSKLSYIDIFTKKKINKKEQKLIINKYIDSISRSIYFSLCY